MSRRNSRNIISFFPSATTSSSNLLSWASILCVYTKYGGPTQKITRGSGSAGKEANDVTRIPPGHPEGYLEGFANIYSDVSKVLFAKINKENYEQSNDCYPTIYDGIEGMKFIETVIESNKNNSKWVQFNYN